MDPTPPPPGGLTSAEAQSLLEAHGPNEVAPTAREGPVGLFFATILNPLTLILLAAGEAAWLRQVPLADGTLHDEGRKFLHELRGQAGDASPEFESLFAEAMRMPQGRRTSGTGG